MPDSKRRPTDDPAAGIRAGLANGDDPDSVEERIRCAEAAGLPLTLW
ncbi:hypothetical protein [Rhodococcus sp. 21391]|nr:hypothetical protein [Rhodococcus sp. 21391]QQZ19445.1 hypothetical protein GO592_40080 [Rhodococcus sp. 21391]